MKIWEAIKMLEQMDRTKECDIIFNDTKDKAPCFDVQKHPYMHIGARVLWLEQYILDSNTVTCAVK